MQQIRIKKLPGIGAGEGKRETVWLDEFIMQHSPGLSMYVSLAKQFPPFHILNEELMSGGSDLGMSGGCFWQPFSLSESEYRELADEMLTSPLYDLEYDQNLEDRKTLKKWCSSVLSHHNPRRKSN